MFDKQIGLLYNIARASCERTLAALPPEIECLSEYVLQNQTSPVEALTQYWDGEIVGSAVLDYIVAQALFGSSRILPPSAFDISGNLCS